MGIPINITPNVNNIVKDIISNTIQANNDQSTIFIEPKIENIKPKTEQKITLNEILTGQSPQNEVKDEDYLQTLIIKFLIWFKKRNHQWKI